MSKSHPNDDSRFIHTSAQGPRDEQQDAAICLSAPERGTAFLVVSDGVGGHGGGRMASQKVIEFAQQLWDECHGVLVDPPGDLATFCRKAHDQINEEGYKHGLSPLTTIAALYLAPTQAYWVHSGDTRLYRFRASQLLERTEDHSVLQILVKQGMVAEKDMGTHPDQGMLLQSLGGEEYRPPTHGMAEVFSEDGFLLCTDGFWERTKLEEMAELLTCTRSQAPLLLEQAVTRAVKRNGPKGDNVTVAMALPADENVHRKKESAPH
jgi:PPM family protein phosphatase